MSTLLTMPPITLPIADPVLKFLIILIIILLTPLLLNKLKIPQLLGLIIAGAVIGPHGFNLILRDSSIILSGTAGLLYIMFLAGLEIDLNDFKKNSNKSLVFGLFTFCVPLTLGFLISHYLLHFSLLSSILFGSIFSSHTLITYPIVSRLGVSKDISVNLTVGGTVITDTLALLVLTVIVGMAGGEVTEMFWIRLGASVVIFGLLVMLVFPIIGRWFFKRCKDNISQFVFVLAMVFLGAFLAQVAGIEAIIGAFLAGMAMNRLIPSTSPLMNRVEFVGNAIFIPFFLLGVGMLIDYRAFFSGWETLEVGAIMIATATGAKFTAAWLTQKTFRLSADQRRVIFGMSNAHVAATLAIVTVGYNVVLGTGDDGEPIRLLNDSVLNGTILMILVSCIISSFATQKGAQNLALTDVSRHDSGKEGHERILISVSNENTVGELINLSTALKAKSNTSDLYAINVVDNQSTDENAVKKAGKILSEAAKTAAATDTYLHELLRYDLSSTNAIVSVAKEHRITDLMMGMPTDNPEQPNPLRHIEWIISQSNVTTFVYRPVQPLSTVKRHLIVVPERAEKEIGFTLWLRKLWQLASSTGAKIVFYADSATQNSLKEICERHPIDAEMEDFPGWEDFLILSRDIRTDDMIWTILSRRDKPSFHPAMNRIPAYLNRYFADNSFILLFPAQGDKPEENRYYV